MKPGATRGRADTPPLFDTVAGRGHLPGPTASSAVSRTRCGILMPLRRAGTVTNTGAWYGPGSAAHHAVKNGALRCARGTRFPEQRTANDQNAIYRIGRRRAPD